MAVKLNSNYLKGFLTEAEIEALYPEVKTAHNTLNAGSGKGNDFLGWLNLPKDYDKEEFGRIKKAAAKIKSDSDILIVIGIGGSYLGARAAIELLRSPFYNNIKKDTPQIFFAGNNINPTYLNELLSICEGKDISINVISKSGTTTEPALAFRIFRELLEKKYGADGAKGRIYCTTDKSRGTLKQLCNEQGYEAFAIADDIGGRYSVLTAVGLLPIAVAGADIDAIMAGAAQAVDELNNDDVASNDCYRYAALRQALYRKGKKIEMLVSYEPAFTMMSEWFKQLFGESEGKENKG
ncbi:MAG: glucose-6-phosphate isomerase, partial [Hydrogenoanaerobacterium sp.]